MAGAPDPLEDMLSTEVDEKAVSDLVGSLESQLGDRNLPAASDPDGKRDVAAASRLSGKAGSSEPQQGHQTAGSTREPGANQPLSGQTVPSSVTAGAIRNTGTGLQAAGAPSLTALPVPVTLSSQPAASFPRAAVLAPSPVEAIRTSSPSLQPLNGSTGAGKVEGSPGAPPPGATLASQPGLPAPQSPAGSPAVTLQGLPSPVISTAQNGLDPKGSASLSAAQVLNHNNPLMHTKMLVTSTPAPAPAAAQASIIQTQTGSSTPLAAAKPAINGVAQTGVRPPGAAVGAATSIQPQRPQLVTATTRPAAPQTALAVRPQQQTTIQLPPGFTIPPGMVLVRTETGQLVLVPQQALAQAQAKLQQSQTVVTQRPATPLTTSTIRVSTATTVPGAPQTVRLAAPAPTRIVQSPSTTSVQPLAVPAAGAVKMPPPQKTSTVITAGVTPAAKPAPLPGGAATPPPAAPPGARVTVVSQEMQENVKKCKNFLSTLIKLASHNSPSPDTSKNVKTLVQDLLDAKIEPEEFTSRLQAELKSSPQPYLIPFLKKSLPALRQTLLNSQQSLTTAPPTTSAPPPAAPGSLTAAAIRPRLPVNATATTVRLTPPITNTAVGRATVQTIQTRSPVVLSQQIRHPATLLRGPTTMAGKAPVHLAAQANQKKPTDPGGGTFRDDDDINDVASMAGVNLNEENARILATSSELVGTKIRSCKDEAFLPPGLLHRRILDSAKKLGVTEVPLEVVNLISHATESRLRSLLEKASVIAQHRTDGAKDEGNLTYEQSSDVRSQLRFFEALERMEKQRKDEQEREMLLKAAKSRARQEDPEQARLKQKAKEMQQQELAQMRQRDANLTALAAIGPRKKRKLDSGGGASASSEVTSGSSSGSSASSSRQQLRQRITRVNLRDFILCLEQDRSSARSLMLYKALLK
ncbi:PREDICTED: transcription initiation factor TFIID subunit 4-like [Poecilia mexicana]|uniref:TAFH domain-containing protein n=1 Tax=Poecilia mexicana TaxID=48701 RepID=A0A3B3XKY9_9TELE|nr:PREDICTED: transcription initiation factor TFIID subunit 4-like [Poecilia mexicana]XP_014861506.1 PREDICTED: transcription initiation factor TFIID subunit 4-like [Poecilia mexicana]